MWSHQTTTSGATRGIRHNWSVSWNRCTSAIVGLARIVLTLTGIQPDEAKAFGLSEVAWHHYFRLDGAKSNYVPLQEAEWYERQPYELVNGDVVAIPIPWTPPETAVTPQARACVETGLAAGSAEGPWSAKLGKDSRSVARLIERYGIVMPAAQKTLLNDLLAAGYCVRDFRKSTNRGKAGGICTPDGAPRGTYWIEDGTGIGQEA